MEKLRISSYSTQGVGEAGKEPKISWKKVAAYIKEQGGSYLFGNAVCKRKYNEVIGGIETDS
jgi:hypothetical protein